MSLTGRRVQAVMLEERRQIVWRSRGNEHVAAYVGETEDGTRGVRE